MAKDKKVDLYLERRDEIISFKITKEEKAIIENHCDSIGVSMSRFIRHIVIGSIEK